MSATLVPREEAAPLPIYLGMTLAEAKKQLVLATVQACGWDITKAAETLGCSRNTVMAWLRKAQASRGQ